MSDNSKRLLELIPHPFLLNLQQSTADFRQNSTRVLLDPLTGCQSSAKVCARPGDEQRSPPTDAQDSDQRWQVYGEAEAVFGEPWTERKKGCRLEVGSGVYWKTHPLLVTW